MRGSHHGTSCASDRRPRGGRKVGRARNRLSKKGRRSASAWSPEVPSSRQPRRARDRQSAGDESPALPLYIRATGTHVGPNEREYTNRKVSQKLGKFAPAIERISVRIDDVNGPRGGVDQACRIKVVLNGHPSIVVNAQHAQAHAAVDAALKGVEQAVRRNVRRRRSNR